METKSKKLFTVKVQFENNYYRLYITHPSIKGRIRKRIGNNQGDDVENIASYLKFELGKHFLSNEISKEAVESFIENYVSVNIKHNASIFDYTQEFINYKTSQTNKRTKKKLSYSTLSGYRTAITYFEKFIIKKGLTPFPSEINAAVLNDYYEYIPGGHNYKVKLHTKLKGFLIYLEKEKNLPIGADYKKSAFTEEYDNQCPEDDDRALTIEEVYKLLELRSKFKMGDIKLERYKPSSKIPEELQKHQFNMKMENIVKCLDCFLLMISTGMYFADISKSQLNFSKNGNIMHVRYRRAKNGSLCKAIPLMNDDIFIGEEIVKQYDIRNGSNFPIKLSLTHFDKHLDRISQLASIGFKITNKMARKTFATHLYFKKELPIHYLQILLGHKDVKDTAHYLRISDDEIAGEVARYYNSKILIS